MLGSRNAFSAAISNSFLGGIGLPFRRASASAWFCFSYLFAFLSVASLPRVFRAPRLVFLFGLRCALLEDVTLDEPALTVPSQRIAIDHKLVFNFFAERRRQNNTFGVTVNFSHALQHVKVLSFVFADVHVQVSAFINETTKVPRAKQEGLKTKMQVIRNWFHSCAGQGGSK